MTLWKLWPGTPRDRMVSWSEPHGGADQRSDVSAYLDEFPLRIDLHMKKASASHLGSLLADESGSVFFWKKIVPEHVSGKRTGGAACCRVLGNSVFWREHARVGALRGWGKHKGTKRVGVLSAHLLQTSPFEPRTIYRFPVFDRDENRRIAGA